MYVYVYKYDTRFHTVSYNRVKTHIFSVNYSCLHLRYYQEIQDLETTLNYPGTVRAHTPPATVHVCCYFSWPHGVAIEAR